MKVLGATTFLDGEPLRKIKEMGYTGSHNQFRIICKCRGIADANKKCGEIGIHSKVFNPGFCMETGNALELELCEKEDIWISIDGADVSKRYASAKELFQSE